LRALQEREIDRVGGSTPIKVDIRVLATTNRNLEGEVRAGRFREDLYYRLQVIEIHVPPLRERREEIVPLARAFVRNCAEHEGRPVPVLTPRLEEALVAYDWPGNVRELENVIQRFVLLQDEDLVLRELVTDRDSAFASPTVAETTRSADSPAVSPVTLAVPVQTESQSLPALVRKATSHVEREVIGRALDVVRWNRRRAARMLGVSYKTLLNKMKTLGLDAKAPLLGPR